MSKRDHDRALDRALALASEYRWLLGDGRSAEAEQVERTIDELVGRWTVELDFVWPRSVAERAGVPHVRLASKEASSPAPPPSTGNTGAASPTVIAVLSR